MLNKKLKSLICISATVLGVGVSMIGSIESHVSADSKSGLVSKSHLTVKDGWSNDLQSITWNSKGQYYDVYYLHSVSATNIFGEEGQNWYHTTTKDFTSFTEQQEAIPSHGGDNSEGWKSAWTGSIVENKDGNIKGAPKGSMVAYFSGLRKSDGKQNVWAAYSTDGGKTFTKPLNNGKPVADINNSVNKVDFRDPYVFTNNGTYFMYVAEGNDIGVYKSSNGVSWEKADSNGASKITSGTFFKGRSWDGNAPVECPVLKTMTNSDGTQKQVLFMGAKDASKGETTGTYYIVGHLDKNGLFAPEGDVQRLDQGTDFYGANFSGSSDIGSSAKELTAFGWIGNWNYTANGVHSDEQATSSLIERLGSYSSARTIKLGADGKISQSVILPKAESSKNYTATKDKTVNTNNGNKQWIDRKDTNGNVYGLYDVPRQSASQTFDLNFTNSKGNYSGRIYIDIWQGNDYVRFNYDPSNGIYNVKSRSGELDKGNNGQVSSSYYFDGLLGNGNGYTADSGVSNKKSINLKVVTDKTSVEFFFPNGQSYTIARFNDSNTQDFKIFTEDPTNSNSVSIKVSNNK